ncbi:Nucleoside-diphosphate-sugar epimerase [Pseudomonas citronellolis]|uniref:Nucleoside-diphosphate-sugar epimerase n=1 Tax=Pseudomonas citronellolis TaxID=53408 RepID=A0AAQ1HLG4_9PSED|nr:MULTISPECIES: NAD(P)-dependent oxidoreductase [Pseudomonas]KES22194.1 NAD-dependent dehydratase [Pseudomonas sp. AAC]MBH3432069.1 NAD(P)-dependent oxidoreductase [Pseudomonas citronellolis]MCL6687339.1 NAD(P)-dependent oxidoreductase [Pseudomonas sp. R3.Fl]MCP1603348.1 nucleoside-diphosphate-sugar epimerase [Pseudomonas citronellolis]MCP1643113.1 nucleoside-diphosphate-sugar epimerase [Pseudomonas citronellolis]
MSRLQSAFVTGAGGFIGRHLVRQLLAEQVAVVALMMPGEAVPAEWGDNVRVVVGDVRRLLELRERIGPVDAIFHLAAVVSDWGSTQSHVEVTVKGTEQAIELALGWGAHFVVTTSVCAFASALAKGRLSEDSPVGVPSSAYEFCKQEQERVTREGVARGLKGTIVRPANVFGVGSMPWVNSLVQVLREGAPCLLGSGDWDAGLVHVNNLVALLIAAARSAFVHGEVFIAADGFGVTWKTYLEALAQAAQTPPPKSLPNWLARFMASALEWWGHLRKQTQRPHLTRQTFRLMGGPNEFAIDKARRLLDYRPPVSFEAAMAELAEHFRTQRQASAGAASATAGLGSQA